MCTALKSAHCVRFPFVLTNADAETYVSTSNTAVLRSVVQCTVDTFMKTPRSIRARPYRCSSLYVTIINQTHETASSHYTGYVYCPSYFTYHT